MRSSIFANGPIRTGLLLVVVLILLPAAASAAEVVECLGTRTVEFSPGLTLTPTLTTLVVTDDYAVCEGASGSAVTSAFRQVVVTLPAQTCTTALDGTPGLRQNILVWDTGETSTFDFTVSVQRIGSVVVATEMGEISDGLFEGATAVAVATETSPDILDCLGTNGVTEITGPAIFTLTLAE
jgi:hypothetical protein